VIGCKALEDGQCKGCGFTGASVGDADNVVSGQHYRDGLILNRRRIYKALGFDVAVKHFIETEVGEGIGGRIRCFFGWPGGFNKA
jgi:hypothetical protein